MQVWCKIFQKAKRCSGSHNKVLIWHMIMCLRTEHLRKWFDVAFLTISMLRQLSNSMMHCVKSNYQSSKVGQ